MAERAEVGVRMEKEREKENSGGGQAVVKEVDFRGKSCARFLKSRTSAAGTCPRSTVVQRSGTCTNTQNVPETRTS